MSILQDLLNLVTESGDNEKPDEKIEAYGVKGVKSTQWRKVFKNQAEFEKWVDKQEGDVEVQGVSKL